MEMTSATATKEVSVILCEYEQVCDGNEITWQSNQRHNINSAQDSVSWRTTRQTAANVSGINSRTHAD